MTPPESARLRAPVRLPFRTKFALRWTARRDGARNVPFIAPMTDVDTVDARTPRIEVLDAEAEDSARAEWRALHDRTRDDRLGHDSATITLAGVVGRIDLMIERDVEPAGASLESEELRRLIREREALQRIIASHEVAIEERVNAALLAVEQIYTRANLLATVYWQALRRHHRHRDALVAEPRALAIPSWVTPEFMAPKSRATDPSTPVDLTERKRRAKN